MKDIDNYEYLRGFITGYETDKELSDSDDFPEGISNLNEAWDRLYELKEKQKESKATSGSIKSIELQLDNINSKIVSGEGWGSSEILTMFGLILIALRKEETLVLTDEEQKTIPRGVVKSFSRRFETLKVIKNPVTGDMGVDESGYLCHYSVDKWIKSEYKLQI